MRWSVLFIVSAIVCISSVFSATIPNPNGLLPLTRLDGRIIGGKAITIDKAPYMAQLIFYGSLACGGSIIRENVILTAAHCINAFTIRITKVRAGSSYRTKGPLYKIRKMIAHEDFLNVAAGDDIGLIWLETPLTFDNTIQMIDLVQPDSTVQAGATASVTGWGYMSLRGYMPDQLMALDVPIVSRDVCNNAFEEYRVPITETMICAGYMEGGKDACSGDSGGPLVIKSRIVGITSFSVLCALKGLPGVYTNVAHYVGWVNNKLSEDLLSRSM